MLLASLNHGASFREQFFESSSSSKGGDEGRVIPPPRCKPINLDLLPLRTVPTFNLRYWASLLPTPSWTAFIPYDIPNVTQKNFHITLHRCSSFHSCSNDSRAEHEHSRWTLGEIQVQLNIPLSMSQSLKASPVELFEVCPRDSLRREIYLQKSLSDASSVVVWQFEVASHDVDLAYLLRRGYQQ